MPTLARTKHLCNAAAVRRLASRLVLSALLASCTEEPKGQLTLAIQTDMKIPEDVDEIRLEVVSRGNLLFANTYEVGPNSNLVPTTVAITTGEQTQGPLNIRLISRQGVRLRTLREVVTTVPKERNVMLRLPIQWLCEGQAQESQPGLVDTTCSSGQTCVSGRCVERELDSEMLPDFSPAEIFGGGSGAGDGSCLDTVACFSVGVGADVDALCSIAAPPEGVGTNIAMVLPPDGDGICGRDACLIPLDRDPEDLPFPVGWRPDGDRLLMPEAVCERLADGRVLGVAVTTACPTKTPALPTCGPWSSVTDIEATFDAGAPTGVFESTCPEPVEGRSSACITLEPEVVETMDADPELDGMGVLLVEVYAEPQFASAEPIATFRPAEEVAVGDLPVIDFDDLPETVYVRAGFFDNPDEIGFEAIQRGGAWVGGGQPGDPSSLRAFELVPDVATEMALPLSAVRRLNVTVTVAEDIEPSDGAEGLVAWTAYSIANPTADAIPTGAGRRVCANLSAGPAVVTGHIYGPGPHHVVATLDDYGLGLDGAALGGVPGSVVSGAPSGAGDGGDPPADPDTDVEPIAAMWSIPDSVDVAGGPNVGALSVELGHSVPVDEPTPVPFDCPGGTCGDGVANGSETDIDCGGTCLPCEASRMCAGPGDCQSRVCDGACQIPTCDDSVQNGSETDSDCGGACEPCAEGRGCLRGSDCESDVCNMSQCQP